MAVNYDESAFVPPWKEWSNDFINAEKWDEFHGENVFIHPGGHERLPKEIDERLDEWKRPDEIFGVDKLSVHSKEDNSDIHHLLTVNEPLMNVKVYRWILHHIVLYASRFKNKWPLPWHPSDMVFSRCKADATWNKKSKPEYNSFGKYWLKLFFMGKFRMVCVSDHLPVDKDNNVLLPLCENNTVLWLPLLVKGLLRIYAMADEFQQFNTITCFTGWSCIRTDCQHVPTNDMWSSFLYHSSNPFSNVGNEWKNEKPTACKQLQDITKCFPIITTKGVQCSRDQINLNCEMQASSSAIVISIILSPNAFSNGEENNSTYSQPIFLNSVKLVKNKLLPTWKRHRWTKWAVENKLIQQHELNDYMNLVNFYAPCTAILRQTYSLANVLSEYGTAIDEMQYELDFSYLDPFTTCAEYYIKSSKVFPFSKSIFFGNENNSVDSVAANPSKNSTSVDNNNCVYLYFESSYCESVLFTLSVCENYTIKDGEIIVESNTPAYTSYYPYINVEQFMWYENTIPTPLSYISTRGMSNDVIKFQPGLNVLKLWSELPTKYSLTIESTVEFSLFKTAHGVYENLNNLTKSLTDFLTPIKQLFLQLYFTMLHTGDREKKLIKFYSLFLPPSYDYEDESQIIEKYSKSVQTAVVEWVENKCPMDVNSLIKVYMELQELFKNKSLGQKQINDLNEKLKTQQERATPVSVKKSDRGQMVSKKSIAKWRSATISKVSTAATTAKAHKHLMSKSLQEINMFEVLCNVLHSDEIDLDEYYLKNDLFNHVDNNVIYDESTKSRIDSLFLFRLDLNTHSVSELVPTIIHFLNKNNNNCNANLILINNDTELEIRPMSVDANLFMVNRTTKGYTLLGWFSKKHTDNKLFSYKLSFWGRSYQILHSCGMQKDKFYKYNTTICENIRTSEFAAKEEKNRFFSPNTANVLARVFMRVENAALYTIYCYLETVEYMTMEIRVIDKENDSMVFALSRTHRGKLALIPIVFLDPNYNHVHDAENSAKTIFVIEVVLTNNVETDYYNIRDESIDYDWTISCIYDKKLTDVALNTDTTAKHFRYVSSIPHKTTVQKPPSRKTPDNRSETQSIRSRATVKKIDALQSKYHQLHETVSIKQNKSNLNIAITKKQPLDPYGEKEAQEKNELIAFLNEIASKQHMTGDAIKKYVEIKTENRQVIMDELYGHVLNLLSIRKSSLNAKQSRIMKKKSQFTK